MTTTLDAVFTGQVTWQYQDDTTIRTILDEGTVGETVEFISSGVGELAVNEAYYTSINLLPQTQYVIDFTGVVQPTPGGSITVGFEHIKAINIVHISGDALHIGTSGISEGITIFGNVTTIGRSGVVGWCAPTGYSISDTEHNLGFYNSDASITGICTVGIVGIRRE